MRPDKKREPRLSAIEIARKSGVHRVNVYEILEKLLEKGLAGTVIKSAKRRYSASDPDQISALLKEKELLLEDAMPKLRKEYKAKKEGQSVYQFEGPEGVFQAYKMMLGQRQTIYAWGGSGMNRQYLRHRHEIWNKERKERNIHGKGLYYENSRGKGSWDDPTMEIRYLPDESKTPCMVDICGSLTINLIPTPGDIKAIVIDNLQLAESYRRFFLFMWQFAKE